MLQKIEKSKTIKLISALLVISILGSTVVIPQSAKATVPVAGVTFDPVVGPASIDIAVNTTVSAGANVTDTGLKIKDFALTILKELGMVIARRAIQEVTKSMVNWINSGFHGAPLFLENPESFFKDIAKSEVKNIIETFGYDTLGFPFGRDFALQTINAYKSTVEENSAYTLSKVTNDPELIKNYQTNFNAGGWNGFLINTQFPQNNALGFQMLATEELAERLKGTSQNAAESVKEALSQGQGFLATETCTVNPKYNKKIANAWNRPSFNEAEARKNIPQAPICDGSTPALTGDGMLPCPALAGWMAEYDSKMKAAKAKWAEENECVKPDGTSGLVRTTPGSVVASQINLNLGSSQRQKELAGAMGNGLSAVFDALITKFLGDGLNSLATKINPPPPTEDNWNYEGMTLGGGGGEGGTNSAWDSSPDIILDLDTFKKQLNGYTIRTFNAGELLVDAKGRPMMEPVIGEDGEPKENSDGTPQLVQKKAEGGETISLVGNPRNCVLSSEKWTCPSSYAYVSGEIENTQREIKLMNEILNYFSLIWPEAKNLDMCIPGPDINWEERLAEESQKKTKKLQELQSDSGTKEADEADKVLKEFKFALSFFEDWIKNKMMTALPSSIFYMEAVEDIKELPQQATELNDAKRLKTQALARLQAIKVALDSLSVAEPGSAQERTLIALKKQHDGVRTTVSTLASLSERQNEIAVADDKLKNLKKMVPECEAERKTKGWGVPGGPLSSYSGTLATTTAPGNPILGKLPPNSEQAQFCNLPIFGGYSHEKFINTEGVTHPEIPLVNAEKLVKYTVTTAKSVLTSLPGRASRVKYASIKMDCNNIFSAKLLDYKGAIPGATTVSEIYIPPSSRGSDYLGTCTYTYEDTGGLEEEFNVTQEECEINSGSWELNEKEEDEQNRSNDATN